MTIASGSRMLAICDRCRMTFKRAKLLKDPNAVGLRVCKDCRDVFNPYRLPPRKMDPIAMSWVRPMVHLVAPIYRVSPIEPIVPQQDRLTPIVNEDEKGIQASGNVPPNYSPFPLPDIIQDWELPLPYPRLGDAEEDDYESPRIKKNKRNSE